MLARSLRLLLVLASVTIAATLLIAGDLRSVGDHSGFAPAQPIAFSHRLHAGEMGLDCLYCHFGAERSRHAGIPEAELCLNCHRSVTAPRDRVLEEAQRAASEGREPAPVVSIEIRKIWRALGLDDERERDPSLEPRPIEWVRVHQLPDFVWFDHRPHVRAQIACETCHGPVQSMERVRQEFDLSMGWCIDCHRSRDAAPAPLRPGAQPPPGHAPHVATDCATCHF
jgi:hypothetical protein